MSGDALVVLSGGQDSTTCLYWAIRRFGQQHVRAITFDYGQRHRIELACAARIAADAGVPHVELPIDTFAALGSDALTSTEYLLEDDGKDGLPVTFVPGRNLVFLTFAAAYCWPRDIQHIVTGVAQTDYSGYPDCRENTIQALEKTLQLGISGSIRIHTPLMHLSKKETVLLAVDVGALNALADTHTCYAGMRPPCGKCQACQLRVKGFSEAGVTDPLMTS